MSIRVSVDEIVMIIDKKPSWTNLELKSMLLKLVSKDENARVARLPIADD